MLTWYVLFVCRKSVQFKTSSRNLHSLHLRSDPSSVLPVIRKCWNRQLINGLSAVIPGTHLAHREENYDMVLFQASQAGPASLASKFVTLYISFSWRCRIRSEQLSCSELSHPAAYSTYRKTEVFASVFTMAPQPVVTEGQRWCPTGRGQMKTAPDVQVSVLPSVKLKNTAFLKTTVIRNPAKKEQLGQPHSRKAEKP